jgi:Initiator Replication protein
MAKGAIKRPLADSALRRSLLPVEERGILESFFKLPRVEQGIVRELVEKFSPGRPTPVRIPLPSERTETSARRDLLLRIYRLIRYHRLIFETVADGVVRSTYSPWVESITLIKTREGDELEIALNSNYEKIWRMLKQHLADSGVRLKSQYSSRLYRWAKQYLGVGYKRVSLGTLRKILGLEELRDESGKLLQEAPLPVWASVKQRALDQALNEINKGSDINLEVEFTGRGSYRKVQSIGFKISQKDESKRTGTKQAAP